MKICEWHKCKKVRIGRDCYCVKHKEIALQLGMYWWSKDHGYCSPLDKTLQGFARKY